MKPTNSYRSILRGFSIFGGVQVFNALIAVVRGKFVAMFLGPAGMGISSLFYTSSISLQRFASLGLNLAIVKEVSAAQQADDDSRVSSHLPVALTVIRHLLLLTSLLGMATCLIGAPLLSHITFGDTSMTGQFRLLGVALFFMISAAGKLSVLQGLQQPKAIGRTTIIGSLTGLFVGVPLYYFYGTDGIVPAFCILWFAIWLSYSLALRRLTRLLDRQRLSMTQHSPLMKRMVMIGLTLVLSDLLQSLVIYSINLYIRSHGNVDTVGLYQAANSLTMQFASMVFTALAMDFFPRLTRLTADNVAMTELVNRQIVLVAIVMASGSTLLITFSPLIIKLLLTEDFYSIMPLLRWMGVGMLVRGLSLPLGYITLAKDNKKVFLLLEGVWGNLSLLLCSCLGYRFFGLIGLGYAYVADNLLCLIIYYIVNRRLYGYNVNRNGIINGSTALILCLLCFGGSQIARSSLSLTIMGIATVSAVTWSLVRLRQLLRRPEQDEAETIAEDTPPITLPDDDKSAKKPEC